MLNKYFRCPAKTPQNRGDVERNFATKVTFLLPTRFRASRGAVPIPKFVTLGGDVGAPSGLEVVLDADRQNDGMQNSSLRSLP